MALDPEEYKKRRELRNAQRLEKAEKAKKKRIKWLLIGAAVLVVAILVLILCLRGCSNTSQTGQTQPNLQTIHFAATGDLNVTQRVVASGTGEDYTSLFMDVAAYLAQADVTAVNLEGGLYGPPYGEDRSAPPALAKALKNAGVDMIQLANSYAIAKGTAGLTATIQGIKEAGLTPLGAWSTPAEAKAAKGYTIREVNGIKLALVAFTKGMDGMALPVSSAGCVNLLYKDYSSSYQEVDKEGIVKVLDAVAKERPDAVIALLHWGSEYNDTVSSSQEAIAELMLENGVDVIVGSHSHYVQKVSFDEAAGTLIAYSLGDFLGDAERSGTEYSVILDVELTKNLDTGETYVSGWSYTPIYTLKTETGVRSLAIDGAVGAYDTNWLGKVTEEDYNAMKYALERITARLGIEEQKPSE